MALYRLEAKIFSREKRGRSVVAAAAYRAGNRMRDERYDRIHDYTRRHKGVQDTAIIAPDGAPAWVREPATLWNTVEQGEKRADAQLAREFILAVPPELAPEVQFQTALDWARKELVTCGMVAHLSLHHPKGGNNPHVHILCTMRRLDGDKFSAKKPREWNEVGLLMEWRESWAVAVNGALEKAGCQERVDHRSLEDRGIDRIPEPKIGVSATAMKRRGVEADPVRFQLVRRVQLLNEVRPHMRSIQKGGEVRQKGNGASWWERSACFLSRVRDKAKKVLGKWTRFLDRERTGERNNDPTR
jgi:ATP-dependent exoDNAse (exonuclease V) alpha subunit